MSEDVPEYIPSFYSESWYDLRDQRVAAVRLDQERDERAMLELLHAVVIIDGKRYQCLGVEKFAHASPWRKGEQVGLLVKPIQ